MESVKRASGQIQKGCTQFFVLTFVLLISGCGALPPISDEATGGINPDYIFGDRRPGADTPIIDDADYAEYLEWKEWQDFQAYQKWRSSRGEVGTIGDHLNSD